MNMLTQWSESSNHKYVTQISAEISHSFPFQSFLKNPGSFHTEGHFWILVSATPGILLSLWFLPRDCCLFSALHQTSNIALKKKKDMIEYSKLYSKFGKKKGTCITKELISFQFPFFKSPLAISNNPDPNILVWILAFSCSHSSPVICLVLSGEAIQPQASLDTSEDSLTVRQGADHFLTGLYKRTGPV